MNNVKEILYFILVIILEILKLIVRIITILLLVVVYIVLTPIALIWFSVWKKWGQKNADKFFSNDGIL